MLSGALLVRLQAAEYVLNPGDSIYFEGAQLQSIGMRIGDGRRGLGFLCSRPQCFRRSPLAGAFAGIQVAAHQVNGCHRQGFGRIQQHAPGRFSHGPRR